VIKVRKYIAIILLEIFLFPIISQPIHVLWHHANPHKKLQGHTNTGYTYDNQLDIENKQPVFNPNHSKLLLPDKDACPVLDYKLSLNELPDSFLYSTILPIVYYSFIAIDQNISYNSVCFIKIPRAPPTF